METWIVIILMLQPGFVWNYSDFFTPKEQCDSYVYATKLMHTPAGDIIKKIENRTTTQSQPTSNPKTPRFKKCFPLPKAKANFTNSNFPVIFSKPNGYLGATVV